MPATSFFVREFHRAFGHPVATHPQIPADRALRRLRLTLILEEAKELAQAFGMDLEYQILARGPESTPEEAIVAQAPGAIALVADALADLDYVVSGGFVICGIPQSAAAKAVHDSNMSKLGEDGKPILRADGKILKGPNFHVPDWSWLAHLQAITPED